MVRQDHSNLPAGELIGAPGLSQSFHSPYAGLYRIDVKLATYARENHGPVEFSLRESLDGPALVRIEFEAEQIQDNAFHQFVFDPVVDSAGREFVFSLEAPDASPGNAITVWRADYDAYPEGQPMESGQAIDGDLTFIVFHRSSPSETWRAFLTHIHDLNPSAWRVRWLLLAAVVIWMVGVGGLLGELMVAGRRGEQS